MTDPQWTHVGRLVEQAQSLPPEERAAFLATSSADEAVRREAASLLAAYEEADTLLEHLADVVVPQALRDALHAGTRPGAPPTSDPLALEGRQISRYAVDAYLGGGGMGVVYRARDLRLGRTVALKFLPPYFVASAEATQRFTREARAASMLDHPNLATVYEIDTTEAGRPFMALAYYEGETLAAKIKRGPLPVDEALDYAKQIADGLAQAHAAGIVHRDVKPANAIVTTRGTVKLLDFGLARIADETALTRPGKRMGTAAYMSPEQARGEPVDARTDLWALGAVLYEMLTGQRPFRGGTDAGTVYAVLHEAPAPPHRHRPGVSFDLEQVVMRLLAKDRTDRYGAAEEVKTALQGLRSGAVPALTPAPGRGSSRASGAGAWPPLLHAGWWSRRRLLGYGAGALVLFVVLAAGVFYLREEAPEGSVPTLAVLPFDNQPFDDGGAGEPDRAFANRVTEDVRAQLAQLGALRVAAHRSVLSYQKADTSRVALARALDADYVLAGRVQQTGDSVRLAVQLVDAPRDVAVWRASYGRPLRDIFGLQSAVAKDVAAALEAEIPPDVQARMERAPTDDLTAYEFFLRGREYLRRQTRKDNETGLTLLRTALERDPDFALARAALAKAYATDAWVFGAEAARADSAVAEGERAVALAPDLAESHAALGYAHMRAGRFSAARMALEQALALKPSDWGAVNDLGIIYLQTGRLADAIRLWKQAVQADPVSARAYRFNLALAYRILGLLDRAEAANRAALALDPDHVLALVNQAHVDLFQGDHAAALAAAERLTVDYGTNPYALQSAGWIYLFAGMPEQARAPLEQAYARSPSASGEGYVRVRLGYVLWQAGERERARALFAAFDRFADEQIRKGNEYAMLRYSLAAAHAVRGDTEQALRWFERAVDAGWPYALTARHDPLFASLREEERFRTLVERMDQRNEAMRQQLARREAEAARRR
jgi:TolB-like protein/Flp pilus assembly protein TadD